MASAHHLRPDRRTLAIVRIVVSLLLPAASLMLLPISATHAADPSPPHSTPADHLRRAAQAHRASRWSDAAAAYRAALQAASDAALPAEQRAPILGELGLCELALGKHRDAAEHLHQALEHRKALSADQQRRFEAGQRKAEAEVGMLFISVDPPDAVVTVDALPLAPPQPSYLVFVEPGTHTVRAQLAGYADAMASVSAPRGGWPSVWLRMSKVTSAPAAQAPKDRPRAIVAAGQPADGGSPSTWLIAGTIGAAAGAALGLGFAITGVVLDAEVEQQAAALEARAGLSACRRPAYAPGCSDLHAVATTRDVVDRLSVGSFVAGGLMGAAVLTSLALKPGKPSRAPLELTPAVDGSHAGVVVRGVF